jgi:hypothetical protein
VIICEAVRLLKAGVALFTVSVPKFVARSLAVFVAITSKLVDPAGVAFDVVIVKVDWWEASPDANGRELGLKAALAPDGRAPMLKLAVNPPVGAPRVTVTV